MSVAKMVGWIKPYFDNCRSPEPHLYGSAPIAAI
jgi:hypothetical protein